MPESNYAEQSMLHELCASMLQQAKAGAANVTFYERDASKRIEMPRLGTKKAFSQQKSTS